MTWSEVFSLLLSFLTYGIFVYSVLIMISYLSVSTYSINETIKYFHKNDYTDYRVLASSPFAPPVTLIAPAYNEGKNIVSIVKSLLSLHYSDLEILLINDGSKDNTMELLMQHYDLEKIPFFIHPYLETEEVLGVYKSRNVLYHKLLIVDKVNGGKSDALNVGVNMASSNLLLCIDADCVLEQDAILKMVKPFLEQTNKRIIGSGGVVRIANSCIIEDGRLVEVIYPKEYFPRMQALEYMRAFILGRMGWSRMNGLLLISGAFGVFDRDIVIKAGGYSRKTVGEDMELVVRMRRYLEDRKEDYKIVYIPDPLCWTEGPNNSEILYRQRNRWARGLYETMRMHKVMFLNKKYRQLGMLSYPFWFFFELLGPVVEFLGFIFFIILAVSGLIEWGFFFAFLAFILFLGLTYSAIAICMDVYTDKKLKAWREVGRLVFSTLTEPFYYHPFLVYSSVRGYLDLIGKKKSWGEMTRQGFTTKTAPAK
jgi:cellulose synthase/poly-beta-1,6-N-acetylglucosamine synthase-like glycosyltransferase